MEANEIPVNENGHLQYDPCSHIIKGNGDKGLDMTYDMLRSAVFTLRAIKSYTGKA